MGLSGYPKDEAANLFQDPFRPRKIHEIGTPFLLGMRLKNLASI